MLTPVAPDAVVAYLKKADGQDKNLKLAQFVMKVLVDRVLGKEHEFEKRRAKLHAGIGDGRKYISACKWIYQIVAMGKEQEKWGSVLTSRQVMKSLIISLTFVEQMTGDLQFAQEVWFKGIPREWLDYVYPVAKSTANFLSLIEDFSQMQTKAHYLTTSSQDPEKAAAYRRDIPRHRLAIIREVCDIALYAHWIENWKRSVTAPQLNLFGLVTSLLGVFEVYCPHTYTQI
eukprot:TRINITY_DN1837_c4_g1_i1.p1 TRINITY_DN1837_c4_g1~~TRINITY_DN1837_c4_g1_i1.p1  ORF type:complete len:251 (+),score=55.60 TRINITY_DN1837_c4_g1_i1:65-754(+)